MTQMVTQNPGTSLSTRLPADPRIAKAYDISGSQWKVLVEAIFPAAKSAESVAMALAYCKSRKMDVMKRPVAIVPVWDSARGVEVETVWPTITEYRITATRTGLYAGKDETVFGSEVEKTFQGRAKEKGSWVDKAETVKFPEWAQITVRKIVGKAVCEFVGPKVYWRETYGTIGGSDLPNRMWCKRPYGQLEKCAEAAALRMAFPEEIGGEPTADEMEGQVLGPAHQQPAPAAITPPDPDEVEVVDTETGEVETGEKENPWADDMRSADEVIDEIETVISGIEDASELYDQRALYLGGDSHVRHPALASFPPDFERAKGLFDKRLEAIGE